MVLLIVHILLIFVAIANGFVVSQEDPVLPVQEIDPANPNYLLRTLPNNEVDIIRCPRQTRFDRTTLTCKIDTTYSKKIVSEPASSLCKDQNGYPLLGVYPNPKDCRSFLQCGQGVAAVTKCPSGTVFNSAILTCDYPLNANCCEFLPENDTKLVGPDNII